MRMRWSPAIGLFLTIALLAGCATTPAPAPQVTTPTPTPTTTTEQPPTTTTADRSYLAKLPPLLDRELFFGDPEIASAQLSPDGRFISFRKPYKDVMNIWVKRVNEPFAAARPITADTKRPIGGYFWSEDGRYILYVQDKGGNENFHIYAVDPAASADPATGVPPSRDLTPMENVRAFIYAVPENTPNQIIIGLNDRNPAFHDVYRLDLTTGGRTLLIQNEERVAGWVSDLNGNVRLAVRQTPDFGTEFLTVESGRLGRVIYSCSFEERCSPIRFNRQGNRVFVVSDRGTEIDRSRLMLLDPATGFTEAIEADPMNEVDFGSAIFSDATEELVGTAYTGDRLRVYPRDPEFRRAYEFVTSKLGDGEVRFVSTTNDDRLMLVSLTSDVNPGAVYLYNRDRGTVEHLYDLRPDIPKEYLAPMRAVRYRARDGRMIPAYLTVPKNVEARSLPTVVYPHGGPWARDVWGFNSTHQFLANRGYAVFSPNFRGSSGFGKTFLNAGNRGWGTGGMQHDISDGVKYLIEQGIADPSRIAIMGGSYGGYATLAGLAFTPDLYAAGVDIVGPSNIATLIRSFPAYWSPMTKGLFVHRVGDPEKPEEFERLKTQSPVYFADRIKAPLLLIHGANDPRVKQAESDQIVVELRQLGRPIEYLVAPDEGHGFAGELNRVAMYAAVERFLARYLGGRYQEDIRPELRQRLAELTVDVSRVQRPQLTETGAFVTQPNE